MKRSFSSCFLPLLFQCVSSRGVVGWNSRVWNSLNSETDVGQIVSMPFKKSRSDTYLRLTWSSNLRQKNRFTCSQWYFLIDGRECTSPAPINANIAHNDNVLRQGTIVGVCKATSAGPLQPTSHQISLNVRYCPGTDPGADTYTGWSSTSTMIVEELCPPQ